MKLTRVKLSCIVGNVVKQCIENLYGTHEKNGFVMVGVNALNIWMIMKLFLRLKMLLKK